MAFLKELLGNALYLTKRQGPVSNQEVSLVSIGMMNKQPEIREAVYPQWFFSARLGQPRSINIGILRDFSKSAWVQMVLNTFKKQITTMPWKIVKEDEENEEDRTEDIKKVTDFLNHINNNGQSVNDINSELITDIGEIDAACINYVYSMDSYDIGKLPLYTATGEIEGYEDGLVLKQLGQRELIKVKAVDGGTMLKQVDIHKNLLNYWQYSFKNPRENPTRFDKEEITYLLMSGKSYDVYGFSPVQSIQQVLELLIQGTRYNKDLYTNNAIPDYLATLPKVPADKLEELKRKWNNSYKGKPHQIGFINWAIDKIQKLSDNNRDLEWLDGQKWYFKLVFAVFGVSPVEVGFFENANKSNDEGQERATVRNALKPYMALLERAHQKTISEILQREDHGLCFKYMPKDQAAEKIEFEQHMKELEVGAMTINEYRNKKGLEPVEWGDEPLRRPFSQEGFSNFGGVPQQGVKPGKQEKPGQEEEKSLKKKDEINAGEDIIEEAEDYSDFLLKTFDRFEKKTLSAADKINMDKKLDKTFGEFLRDTFNIVNTIAFSRQVKRYLKADLVAGMVSAEKETGIDIGFTQAYQDKLDKLQGQQVDGYTINGKKWPGIKGVTKEIQANVIRAVQEAINKGKSKDEIKAAIKEVFDGFSEWRSEMIGRTETTKILAEGKLLGYKETGIKGKKVWSAALDNRTSDICRRLNGQERELDEPFKDPGTLKDFMTPGAHPNCRSTIFFKPI